MSSIYDSLPEGLFHPVAFSIRCRDKEDVLAQIKEQREEERYAKRFFSLFDTELEYNSERLRDWERGYYLIESSRRFLETFIPLFEIIKQLSKDEANRFVMLVPQIHEIRKDMSKVAIAISQILNIPIKIVEVYKSEKTIGIKKGRLGEARLGVDTFLEGSYYSGKGSFLMIISDVEASLVRSYLNGGERRVVLDELCKCFLQANKGVEVKIEVRQSERDARLSSLIGSSKKIDAFPSCLGINTLVK